MVDGGTPELDARSVSINPPARLADTDGSVFSRVRKLLEVAPDGYGTNGAIDGGSSKPEKIARLIDRFLNDFGERWVGETWSTRLEGTVRPFNDLHVHQSQERWNKVLATHLSCADGRPSDLLGDRGSNDEILVLLHLWFELFCLWDRSLAYHTVGVFERALRSFATQIRESGGTSWHDKAVLAACSAIGLISADMDIFELINQSETRGLIDSCARGAEAVTAIKVQVESLLLLADPSIGDQHQSPYREIREAFRYIDQQLDEEIILISVISASSRSIDVFERWMTSAPRQGPAADLAETQDQTRDAFEASDSLVGSLDETIRSTRKSISGLKRTSTIYSRCLPWIQLLIDLREFVAPYGVDSPYVKVLVPRQALVRYCYPFAIDIDTTRTIDESDRYMESLHPLLGPKPMEIGGYKLDLDAPDPDQYHAGKLDGRLSAELAPVLGDHLPSPAVQNRLSAFWQGSGEYLVGGVRIDLPDLETTGNGAGSDAGSDADQLCANATFKVWLELNRMGNHSLCIESRVPMDNPIPSDLYRALRRPASFVTGDRVSIALASDENVLSKSKQAVSPGEQDLGADSSPPSWDNLHRFARDVVHATATAMWDADAKFSNTDLIAPYVRGHPHTILMADTDNSLGFSHEDIEDSLRESLGGQIILGPTHRVASTLAEWIRFPTPEQNGDSIAPRTGTVVPEIGFRGDWIAQNIESTTIGLTASPSWLRDVYLEATQFAISWRPVMQMWNLRLTEVTRIASDEADEISKWAQQLRNLEKVIRLHLSDVRSEHLCQSLVHRRFLDLLLDSTGVTKLEVEITEQLSDVERITDFFSDRQRQRADSRIAFLLALVGVFGVFDLVNFLDLANDDHFHEFISFSGTSSSGHLEVLLVAVSFIAVAIICILLLGWYRWFLPAWLRIRSAFARKEAPTRRRTPPGGLP